jgi:hypothetical protein
MYTRMSSKSEAYSLQGNLRAICISPEAPHRRGPVDEANPHCGNARKGFPVYRALALLGISNAPNGHQGFLGQADGQHLIG